MTRSNRSIYKAMESAARAAKREEYVLRLYVAGTTPRSREAIRTVTEICEERLAGRCDLEMIDIYQQPLLAKSEQICRPRLHWGMEYERPSHECTTAQRKRTAAHQAG